MPKKILIIGYVWPELQSSAAGLRDWNLIETFRQAGWDVLFASSAKENAFSECLKSQGIPIFPIHINHPDFDELIRQQQPNFVIFDRFVTEEQFGWRIQEIRPETILILDTQDLHFLRRSREKMLRDQKSIDEISQFQVETLSPDALREFASIYRCDSSLILSDFEKNLLMQRFGIPDNLLFLSRFHYPPLPTTPEFNERQHFVVIGNFRHAPNADGVRWLHKEIWPSIREKLPQAEVHIYGAYPSKEMMNLSNPVQGFRVLGPTPDQFATLQKYRVNLAPLRFGAGIKGKIADGWWSGTPVVTTPIGAEGMYEAHSWGGEIASSPLEFAQQAIRLYSDPHHWSVQKKSGQHLMQTLYSGEKNAKALLDHLLSIEESISSRRSKNIVGSILAYHSFRSTKYFSKWIEAKNQLLTQT